MSEFDAQLGHWLAEQRIARDMSQEAIGLQLGYDQPLMSKIERGVRKMSVEELLHWAEAVGVSQTQICEVLAALREEFAPPQSLHRDDD